LEQFNFSRSNARLIIDTTAAKINLFFDVNESTNASHQYFSGNGNLNVSHVHCYGTYRGGASNSTVTLVALPNTAHNGSSSGGYDANPCGTRPAGTTAAGAYFQPCSQILSTCPKDYDLAELLNFFSLGRGAFTINGNGGSTGLNIYAPKSSITLSGGGSNSLNFLGRLWADAIKLNGGVSMTVLSSNPAFCGSETCPPTAGVNLFEFVARSFSHASAY
jgi:hypothetical protein